MPSSVNSARPVPGKFQVAFSYAGEDRELVSAIATEVERRLGTGTVFYDRWYEHYIAGKNSDLKLQSIYGRQCELAVVCVSKSYNDKMWTLTEHDAIRERLLKVRNSADKGAHYYGVLYIGVAEGRLDDMLSMDIVPDVSQIRVQETADLIIGRLRLALQDRKEDGGSPQPLPRNASGGSNVRPSHLHYLCDRGHQEDALTNLFKGKTRDRLSRPVLVIVHGDLTDAHTPFVHRMCNLYLPRLKELRLNGAIPIVRPSTPLTSKNVDDLSNEVRRKLGQSLQIESPCASNEEFLQALGRDCAAVIAPVFDLSSSEAFIGEECYVKMLLDCWSRFPDLPPDCMLICFICVKYLPQQPAGLLSKIMRFKKPSHVDRLKALIHEIERSSKTEGARVLLEVLPTLNLVSVNDVDVWFESPQVAPHLKRGLLTGAILSEIFEGEDKRPMEHVLGALEKFLEKHT